MMDLETARAEIRETDAAIAALFSRRMEAVKAVAAWKKERGLPVYDPAQEARVLENAERLVPDDELRSYYVRFQQGVMDVSKQYQHRLMEGLRVACNGVEGAFAHIAAKRIFPDGTPVFYGSFEEAYHAVSEGDCDCAVLPIENSYAGEVGQVIDLMFRGDLHVNGVWDLRISQNLLGTPEAAIEDVTAVVSHPQALSQCRNYLRSRGLEQRSASSTADAARMVAETGDKRLAAIASAETAKLYGLRILDHDINESRENTTRFAVFSRVENAPPERNGSFLLLFTVKNEAGALAKAIGIIGDHGFNMKALRSRPMKTLAWNYYFYVEAEGDDASEKGKQMLEALRSHCAMLKIAGRYSEEHILEEDAT